MSVYNTSVSTTSQHRYPILSGGEDRHERRRQGRGARVPFKGSKRWVSDTYLRMISLPREALRKINEL
jgi:hypothetical protein